jgi:membrane fusion protein, multidrug efflux system
MHFLRLLPILIAGTLALPGCGRNAPRTPAKTPRPVTVTKAVTEDVPYYLDEIGNCTAFESVTIKPQVSGAMTGIHFKDGAEVAKGDPLFTLDPRPFQAALAKARATLAQDRAKAQYALIQVKRNEDLRQKKAVSDQEYDSARSTAEAAVATVQADEADVNTAQINLDYCQISSPIDGRASKRNVDQGNIVISNSTSLLVIQRQDPIYVDFTIPEDVLPQVRHYFEAGTLKVEASFPNDASKKREGKFDFLDSGVQANSGTVRLRALLDNKDRLFWPGQFVNVRLVLETLKAAVLIPNEALQVGQDGPFVFVVKPGNTVELRHVEPGQRQEDRVVIKKGLKADETVVVTGQIALSPGVPVSILPQ